jgi:hypothetical protein
VASYVKVPPNTTSRSNRRNPFFTWRRRFHTLAP